MTSQPVGYPELKALPLRKGLGRISHSEMANRGVSADVRMDVTATSPPASIKNTRILKWLTTSPLWDKFRRPADPHLVDLGKPLWYHSDTEMPRKVRQLIADLEKAGFVNRGGKGSHRNYIHPTGARVTISGQPGCDARPYQERQARRQIEESKK